jgi:hypothetical protein
MASEIHVVGCLTLTYASTGYQYDKLRKTSNCQEWKGVDLMWTLITSDGRRANIGSEEDARRTVHTLGTTQLRGPFSWDVVGDDGRRFVVEIRHRGHRP